MTLEEQLKQIILNRYKSIRAFTVAIDIPYSTLDSVFKRGIVNSGIGTVSKVFSALGLDLDSIQTGTLAPETKETPAPESEGLSPARRQLIDLCRDLDEETSQAVLEMIKAVKSLREK